MHLIQLLKELSLQPQNTQELRGLILDLAVRGRLTKEWREEHPGIVQSEVLNQNDVAADFPIPNSWKCTTLDTLSEINGGFAFKSTKYSEQGVRVIRISDFDESGLKDHKIKRYPYTSELDRFKLERADILMAMTGGTVGKSLFVTDLVEPMYVNQRVAKIHILPSNDASFIYCTLQSSSIQAVINDAKNSTNDNISMRDIKGFKIPLPPLAEQKAIVEIVDQLLADVDALEEQLQQRVQLKEDYVTAALRQLKRQAAAPAWAALQPHFKSAFDTPGSVEQLRQAILQLAVQGKLTAPWRQAHPDTEPASVLLEQIQAEKARLVQEKQIKKQKALPPIEAEEVPFDLPEGWVWCRWNDLLSPTKYSMKRGPFGSSLRKADFVSEGIRVFEQYNPINNDPNWVRYYITEEKYEDMKAFTAGEGDFLISCSGATLGRIVYLPQGTESGIINQALLKLRLAPEVVLSDYYLKLFRSEFLQSRIWKRAKGMAIPNMVGVKELKKILIPIPPLAEQKAIVALVDDLLGACDRLRAGLEVREELLGDLMKASVREVRS